MSKTMHPTKRVLIETASALLEGHRADEIQVDEVLNKSGISKGSLYHHFVDFNELIETAMVGRFVSGANRDIAGLRQIFEQAGSKNELLTALEGVTESTQSAQNQAKRFERAEILAKAQGNPRLREILALEQDRVTGEFAQLVEMGQAKGWLSKNLDSLAIAVFIQAYTLGRIIDDVAEKPIASEKWNALINHVLRAALAN